tara:strand:- start:13145 stop:13459 length:315 start_codon:yes stop_codon:yes gene_type:complete
MVKVKRCTHEDRLAAFASYHEKHPEVWRLFLKFTKEAMLAKRKRFGARLIWERMRWYVQIEKDDGADYKLNDHHPPFYARLFINTYPQFADFFEIRERRRDQEH